MTNVLIVDDDTEIRETLTFVLQDEGYTTRTAANGEEGLRKLTATDEARGSHFVVLVDIYMPVMNGIEFLQAASADAQIWSRIRCIAITAYSGAAVRIADLARATQTSVPFLEKPFTLEGLLDTVNATAATLPTPTDS